ncbi:MAG: LmbE family protein [Acidimicrobiales bacterium]|nr:LmbE family protein [Acidimicrobiales bacterium]
MGTIVSFHAHPDDESIGTAGTLSRAADAGHRVVLVFATRGELGEPVPGVLDPDEQLAMRRTAEVYESARIIGAERVEFLGYTDSGMMGEGTNDAPWCFWQADVDHAARRLAAILDEEQPDILTVYDDNGGYGHPDHIQVHRVGRRAGELAGVPIVAQGTINRTAIERAIAAMSAGQAEVELPEDAEMPAMPDLDANPGFGKPEEVITHRVDAPATVDRKRASMLAHASQIAPDHFLIKLPPEAFANAMGTEWWILDPLPGPDAPAMFSELFQPIR